MSWEWREGRSEEGWMGWVSRKREIERHTAEAQDDQMSFEKSVPCQGILVPSRAGEGKWGLGGRRLFNSGCKMLLSEKGSRQGALWTSQPVSGRTSSYLSAEQRRGPSNMGQDDRKQGGCGFGERVSMEECDDW